MPNYICITCGTQFEATSAAPEHCRICEDERQYVNWNGQSWTTLQKLCETNANTFRKLEPDLYEIHTSPQFGIGQRALLVRTEGGNFLWDCISLVDEATVDIVELLGGLSGIAISHPHYFSSMVEWSRAFGDAPVYLHEGHRDWVSRSCDAVEFWEGRQKTLAPGLTLHHGGGHFPGSTFLHWEQGAGGRGALLTGDTLNVEMDRRTVAFMYSFPNRIPLPRRDVEYLHEAVRPLRYDRVHGAWPRATIWEGARAHVEHSFRRYLRIYE
jgi:glyoxylase-like metal-dependent hydrolase (beta-lactamase superfamily II)